MYYDGGAYNPPRQAQPYQQYDMDPNPYAMKQPSPYSVGRERWSWASTVCSVVSMWFCCAICGFVGTLYAILGYADHKSGDHERSRGKIRCSWGWAIAAIVCGIIIIVTVIAVFTTVYKTWLDQILSATSVFGT